MDITITTKENAAVISIKGDFDFHGYKEFETIVECAIVKNHKPIVVDLSEVPHVDSMGLGSLTKFWKQASQQDILLCIAGANKNVRSLINLVNLDKRIKLFDNVEEALS